MKKEKTEEILQRTKAVYSQIAGDFDRTRKRPWSNFDSFLEYIHPGAVVLDAGCGNGRLLHLFQNKPVNYRGLDNNPDLLSCAKKHFPSYSFILGDICRMPFPDDSFDAVFCIAVLHHIPGKALRLKALQEMHRVLKKSGVLILTVWDLYHLRNVKRIVAFTFQKVLLSSEYDFGDIEIPWNKQAMRYYHCFTISELRRLVSGSSFCILESGRWVHGRQRNLFVVARKK